mmetsp:Transcript_43893/g.93426  ORF Transcript_43893/g.93426 Transcript_43893/m.93426 type:complete len:215 (-) Transcript_43893:960-1604(-)
MTITDTSAGKSTEQYVKSKARFCLPQSSESALMLRTPVSLSCPGSSVVSSTSSAAPFGSCSVPYRRQLASWSLAGTNAAALSSLTERRWELTKGNRPVSARCTPSKTGECCAPEGGGGHAVMLRESLPSGASPCRARMREMEESSRNSAVRPSPPSTEAKAETAAARNSSARARAPSSASASSRESTSASNGWYLDPSRRTAMQCTRGCDDAGG